MGSPFGSNAARTVSVCFNFRTVKWLLGRCDKYAFSAKLPPRASSIKKSQYLPGSPGGKATTHGIASPCNWSRRRSHSTGRKEPIACLTEFDRWKRSWRPCREIGHSRVTNENNARSPGLAHFFCQPFSLRFIVNLLLENFLRICSKSFIPFLLAIIPSLCGCFLDNTNLARRQFRGLEGFMVRTVP